MPQRVIPKKLKLNGSMKTYMHAFDSPRNFATCAFLLAQVLLLLPILEEAVFRWLLFMLPARLAGKGGQLLAAPRPDALGCTLAVAASALFSAAHYISQPFPDSAFIALFFFGLAQCWLYAKTDRIWCPMLNHALFNLTNIALLLVLPQ